MNIQDPDPKALLKSLLVLGSAIEARDPYTGGHVWRVALLAEAIGRGTGLRGDALFLVTLGGFLHDIGKIGIPDKVLHKRGPLDDEEYAIIKTHPAIGLDILTHHPLGHLVSDVVAHHHEWVDGRGYPDGVANEGVTRAARIMSIADAFDALTSTRPYRAGMPIDKAFAIMREGRGNQFDDTLLDVLFALNDDDTLHRIVLHSSPDRSLQECPKCGPVVIIPKDAKPGDTVYCKSCSGEHRVEDAGDALCATPTGNHGTAHDIRPTPDLDAVQEILARVPDDATFLPK